MNPVIKGRDKGTVKNEKKNPVINGLQKISFFSRLSMRALPAGSQIGWFVFFITKALGTKILFRTT